MTSLVSKISIIGTAGRNADAQRMTKDIWYRMIEDCERLLHDQWKLQPKDVHLVSGGAAWADHLAVTLAFMGQCKSLTLHLPCEFILDEKMFDPTDPTGIVANTLHMQFSKAIGINTLHDLAKVHEWGAQFVVHRGFHARNRAVATSPTILAYTWSETDEPPLKSGTRHTWDLAKRTATRMRHVSLHSLKAPVIIKGQGKPNNDNDTKE